VVRKLDGFINSRIKYGQPGWYISATSFDINELDSKFHGPDTTIFNAWNKIESFKINSNSALILRMQSCGIGRRVAPVRRDFSEERIVSIIGVKKSATSYC
jgi:hypothetical protein